MPIYSLRARGDGGFGAVSEIGFYQDDGAVAYARRTAGSAMVEVWRDQELVAVVGVAQPVGGPVHVPLSVSV